MSEEKRVLKIITMRPLVLELPEDHSPTDKWTVLLPNVRITLIDLDKLGASGAKLQSDAQAMGVSMSFKTPVSPGVVCDVISDSREHFEMLHERTQRAFDEKGGLLS